MSANMRMRNKNIVAIDLFCGAGGLTKGLEKSGIDVCLGIDIDTECEYPYTANNDATFLLKSVEDVRPIELKKAFNGAEVRLLAGCAPCQTFSTYNQKANSTDKRWWLLRQFARLAQKVKPEIITMENVPGLMEEDVFIEFLSVLKKFKYYIEFKIVNCAEYGLPQHRNRLILLSSKLGSIRLLTPNEFNRKSRTVRDVIGKLPPLEAGESDINDLLHQSSSLSPLNLKRIKASRPGGTWRDWPKCLVVDCHKKMTGHTYPSVYGRMSWDEPSPTITTQFFGFGNGRFGHPEQDRAISLREGAMFQGFPKGYRFVDKNMEVKKKVIGRLIGNAVPVKLAEVIGKSIVKHVNDIDQDR
jgi:DNA (cytosine-5)-methyltransferase 1